MEKVELSSRLSAFDSFLFLVQTKDQDQEQERNQSDHAAGNSQSPNVGIEALAHSDAKLCLSEEQGGKDDCNSNAKNYGVKRHNLTELSASFVQIHESNVRCIPGSKEELQEMSNRLNPFDEYMFLLDCESQRTESKMKGIGTKRKTVTKDQSIKNKLLANQHST
jgi:hypothetical protein